MTTASPQTRWRLTAAAAVLRRQMHPLPRQRRLAPMPQLLPLQQQLLHWHSSSSSERSPPLHRQVTVLPLIRRYRHRRLNLRQSGVPSPPSRALIHIGRGRLPHRGGS